MVSGRFQTGLSVETLIRLACPAGTELVAGAGGLGREVTWPAVLRTRPPAFQSLRGGEVALIATEAMRILDPSLTLVQVLRSLAGVGVAAVAVLGEIPPEARDLSNKLDLPLLKLPAGTNLHDLEQTITRTVADWRTELHQRGQEIYRQLTELALAGRGIVAILERLAALVGNPAVLEDIETGQRYIGSLPGEEAHESVLGPLLEERRSDLAGWPRGVPNAADPPVERFPLALGLMRLVAPVVVRERVAAYLSVIGPPETLTELDALAVRRAAAACAIELARERAVLETEDRLHADLVDSLLSGTYGSVEGFLARAERLGYDLRQPHAVVVFAADGANGEASRLREALLREANRRGLAVPCTVKSGRLIAFYPVGEGSEPPVLKSTAEHLRTILARETQAVVSGGLGRLYPGLEGLRTAHREAEGALLLGTRLFGPGRLTYFGDLGLYRLLLAMQGRAELEAFYQETLGRLVEYDQRNASELLKTLEAYFRCHGSPTAAAAVLHVHRNTLLYRLSRIREITGLDLDDAEVRLALHLALRIGEVLAATQRQPAPPAL